MMNGEHPQRGIEAAIPKRQRFPATLYDGSNARGAIVVREGPTLRIDAQPCKASSIAAAIRGSVGRRPRTSLRSCRKGPSRTTRQPVHETFEFAVQIEYRGIGEGLNLHHENARDPALEVDPIEGVQ
jgi:hypothetical protein